VPVCDALPVRAGDPVWLGVREGVGVCEAVLDAACVGDWVRVIVRLGGCVFVKVWEGVSVTV
jgi:hypothetical protein